jgi:sec-independent protein translocase protein TatB
MFEFDAGKLVIIGIVALIVIGPKELPRVMRRVGKGVAKLRHLGAEFQSQFMEAMREVDTEEMKAEFGRPAESAKIDLGVNPLALAKAELTSALETAVSADKEMARLVAPVADAPPAPTAPHD